MGQEKWVGRSAKEWLAEPGQMGVRKVYLGHRDQVTKARKEARDLLAGAACTDLVELAVSELAANAIRHTRSGESRGWFGVETVYADPVRVLVIDQGGHGIPTILPEGYGDPSGENGRGLRMLYELALAFGVYGSRDHGHIVWVDFPRDEYRQVRPYLAVPLAS